MAGAACDAADVGFCCYVNKCCRQKEEVLRGYFNDAQKEIGTCNLSAHVAGGAVKVGKRVASAQCRLNNVSASLKTSRAIDGQNTSNARTTVTKNDHQWTMLNANFLCYVTI